MTLEQTLIILHVFAAGIMLGLVMISVALALRKDFSAQMLSVMQKSRWLGPLASVLVFLSGAIMYSLEPDEFRTNWIFWIKMGLYFAEALIAAAVIDSQVREIVAGHSPAQRLRKLKGWYLVHAVLLLTITALGVMLTTSR
jgi:uncharacterized membrane protein